MIAFDFLKSIRAQHSRMLYCGLYILLSGILVVALSVQPNFDVFFLTLSIGLNLFWLALSIGLVAIVSRTIHSVRQRPTKRAAITRLVAFLLILMILVRVARLFEDSSSVMSPLAGSMWIGSSYLFLRLIHLLLDYQRLGNYSTLDAVTYAIFPSALVAGPIHRMNDFLPQLDRPHIPRSENEWIANLWRIALGIFKKLALSSLFGLMALDTSVANNLTLSWVLCWISVFSYSFMLYFDFSGYSDIAIGTAGILGITLPENFANPYAQRNLTRFWQCWHISLSNWLRDYLFFPTSRTLLKRLGKKWSVLILAIAHLTTMVLAGLWHGFGSGFILWGLWHGIGLFVHARWNVFARQHDWQIPSVVAIPLTFVFVSIGWVFFALPNAVMGIAFLGRLLPR